MAILAIQTTRSVTYNRTVKELKLYEPDAYTSSNTTYNRTVKELK